MKKVTEVEVLRISVARIAQAAGVSMELLELSKDSPYEAIVAAAQNNPRGWNSLAAEIVDELGRRQQQQMARVYITVEGGLVQNVTSDTPLDVTIIDFDTDGCTAEDGAVEFDGATAFLHEPWTTTDRAECDRLQAEVEAAQPAEDEA